MTEKAFIGKKSSAYNLYIHEFAVYLHDFSSEEGLIRHVFNNSGEGEYIIQVKRGNGQFSEALWKGYIKDLGSDTIKFGRRERTIAYQNNLQDLFLENQIGLDQRDPKINQKIKV